MPTNLGVMAIRQSTPRVDGIGRRQLLGLTLSGLALPAMAQSSAGLDETPVLNVCQDFYPYTGVVDGKASGFNVELVQASYITVNVVMNYRPLPYARIRAEAERGQVLGCSRSGRTRRASPPAN